MPNQTVLEAKRLGIFSCHPHSTLAEVALRIAEEDISGIVVVDDEGYLAGVLTRIDLLRAYVSVPNWKVEQVGTFMSGRVITVTPDTTLLEVAKTLLEHHVHRVIVVHEEKGRKRPVAVIGDTDLVYHMMR